MAVFPWGHSRTRTTSSEKKQETTPGWFTRATTEPSRQALADLMKQHSRTVSGGSGSYQGRSRTNTASSKHSRYCSTTPQSSAAPSRIQSPIVSVTSPSSRPESSAKSAVTRSEDSRRNSSKTSADSSSVSNMVVLSPPRFTPSRMGFRKRESVVSPTRSDSPRVSISKPYDFQHVTHTEQVEFNGLGKIDETELATKFSAIQDHQQSNSVLRGIRASELGVVTPPLPPKSLARPQSPSVIKTLDLPMTPPRPSPPPKDSPPAAAPAPTSSLDIRMSRSIENFSRPKSRSAINIINNSPIRSFASQPKLAPAARITDPRPLARESVIVANSPQVPTIGHAVSTQDDTARCMISAPLPPPPIDTVSMDHRPSHRRQSSSKGSLRHMSTFPSARNPRSNVVLQDTQLLGIQEENEALSRHRSEDMLRRVPRSDSYTSNNVVAVDDWEGAIDYAWEHEDDVFEVPVTRMPAYNDSTRESFIIVQQPAYEQISTPSTPLMMMGLETSVQGAVNTTVPSISTMDEQAQTDGTRPISPMVGLGIEAQTATQSQSRSRPPTLALTVPDHSSLTTGISSRLPNNIYSAVSKSSSQESIILSIASSILGTHRSSNSSVSPAEYAHLMTSEDPSSVTVKTSPSQLEVNLLKAARPESTCVPAALLQGFLDVQYTQEQATDFQADQTKRDTNIRLDMENDDVGSLPMRERHGKSTSNPSIPIPQRRSSISIRDGQHHLRQHTNAAGSHRRQAAASYSLFPTAVSAASTS